MNRLKKLLGVVGLVLVFFFGGSVFADDLIWTIEGHERDINSLAFSMDGTMIAPGNDNDKIIKLWDAQSDRLLNTLKDYKFDIKYVVFGQDSAKIEGE